MSNLVAMRKAGQSGATVNKAAIEILKGITDKATINALRYEYVVGYVMADDTDAKVAIDYLPAQDAKPGTKGKWQPFPVNEPATFDATVHRPLVIHNRYRAALTAWSQVRASAGLASKVAPRAPRVDQGEPSEPSRAPVTLETFAVPAVCDTTLAAHLVRNFDKLLTATLKRHGDRIRGEVGAVIRKLEGDLRAYVADLAKASEADAVPSPTVNAARDAELEASRKAMAEMAERLKAMEAQIAKPKAVKMAKAA